MTDIQTAPLGPFAGRYVLGDVLGTGGTATVYRAQDLVLGRQVAIKILGSQGSDPALMQREKSEVALLASLNHHSLVTLYDADVARVGEEERRYLVMELVDGPTLDTRIQRGPVAPADLRRMLIDLAEALHVVHAAGVVHRDIKPGNILLAPTLLPGREFSAKLADFGIASLVDSTRVTATGTVIGTAAYLSPEQARGARVGPPTDVYSLGLVLLEAMTGHREFPGTVIESLTARMNRDPIVPGTLGYEWKSILTAMTARHPAQRPTAQQLLERAEALAISMDGPETAAVPATILSPTRVLPTSDDRTVALEPVSAPLPAASPAKPRAPRRLALWVVGASAAVVVAAAAVFAGAGIFRLNDPTPAPAASASPAAGTTPTTSATSGAAEATAAAQPSSVEPATPHATTTQATTPAAATVTEPSAVPAPVVVPKGPAAPAAPAAPGKGNGKGKGVGKGKNK
jgi:serine/threonine protein kinase